MINHEKTRQKSEDISNVLINYSHTNSCDSFCYSLDRHSNVTVLLKVSARNDDDAML